MVTGQGPFSESLGHTHRKVCPSRPNKQRIGEGPRATDRFCARSKG